MCVLKINIMNGSYIVQLGPWFSAVLLSWWNELLTVFAACNAHALNGALLLMCNRRQW